MFEVVIDFGALVDGYQASSIRKIQEIRAVRVRRHLFEGFTQKKGAAVAAPYRGDVARATDC